MTLRLDRRSPAGIPMKNAQPIAIIGAGFSGTLLAINLLRLGQSVVLIERDAERVAKGQAFATKHPEHLLNVRASNMSAYPDQPDHFCRWMGFSSDDQRNRFVPRLAYGQYLSEQLLEALAAAPGLAQILSNEVVAARSDDGRITLRLDDGNELACRAAVLALGNFEPTSMPALENLPPEVVINNPWSSAAFDGLQQSAHVFLVGTGLTAIDVALSLDRSGHAGPVTLLSRRGLRPRSHTETGPIAERIARPRERGSALLQAVRARAALVGWRQAVDELRPHTQDLWRLHDKVQQSSFLRHARAFWDVHRHRLAPAVDRKVTELQRSGRLAFVAGRIISSEFVSGRCRVTYRPRNAVDARSLWVDRVVNCSGPALDLRELGSPLLVGLLETGDIRSDDHGLGIDVDGLGRVRDQRGKPKQDLFAVGPFAKGEAWELVAVPDIRKQVWNLARHLANEHWVGGEGL